MDIWVETEILDILARMGFKDFKESGVLRVLSVLSDIWGIKVFED